MIQLFLRIHKTWPDYVSNQFKYASVSVKRQAVYCMYSYILYLLLTSIGRAIFVDPIYTWLTVRRVKLSFKIVYSRILLLPNVKHASMTAVTAQDTNFQPPRISLFKYFGDIFIVYFRSRSN